MQIDGHELTLVHEDERRRLYEYNDPNGSSIQCVEAKQACRLGEHYHREKDENIEILEGGGVLFMRVIFSINEHPISGLHWRPLNKGDKTSIAAFKAHAFVLSPGTIMVCRSHHQWHSSDDYDYRVIRHK